VLGDVPAAVRELSKAKVCVLLVAAMCVGRCQQHSRIWDAPKGESTIG